MLTARSLSVMLLQRFSLSSEICWAVQSGCASLI